MLFAQVNDYTYKDDPEKAADSRYIHRGVFPWALTQNIEKPGTVQHELFGALDALERIRRENAIFDGDAEMSIGAYSDPSILWISRRANGRELNAIFNFSDNPRSVWMPEEDAYTNLVTGETNQVKTIDIAGWSFVWLEHEKGSAA